MIQSMTAFARESESTRQGTVTLELRTVNHRYLVHSFPTRRSSDLNRKSVV